MKKFTKLFGVIALVVMLTLTLCLATACGSDDERDETNWNKRNYIIYVYLADGKTPVANAQLALCYNTETSSSCLVPAKTDEKGRVELVIPDGIEFVGNPVVHFVGNENNNYNLPQGYTFPEGLQTITMNGVATPYEHAMELTHKVTDFVLTQAN